MRKFRLLILLLVTFAVGSIAFILGFITALSTGLPELDPASRERLQQETKIYANDSKTVLAVLRGDEARIIVESDEVSDNEAVWLSKDIARRIEKEVQYPGEIKVTVIRETRAVGFAR